MPTILKIGFEYYAVRNTAAAAAAVNALTGSIKLARDYDAEGMELYFDEHQPEIGTLTVRADQIRTTKGGKSTVVVSPGRKRISNAEALRLGGG